MAKRTKCQFFGCAFIMEKEKLHLLLHCQIEASMSIEKPNWVRNHSISYVISHRRHYISYLWRFVIDGNKEEDCFSFKCMYRLNTKSIRCSCILYNLLSRGYGSWYMKRVFPSFQNTFNMIHIMMDSELVGIIKFITFGYKCGRNVFEVYQKWCVLVMIHFNINWTIDQAG